MVESRGRGHRDIVGLRQRAIHVSVNHVRDRKQRPRLEGNLVEKPEVRVEDPPDGENAQDDDQGLEKGNRDIAHLDPLAAPVTGNGFVVLGVDASKGRKVNDRCVAGVFPRVDDGKEERPVFRRVVPRHGADAEKGQHLLVHHPGVVGQEGIDEVADHDH